MDTESTQVAAQNGRPTVYSDDIADRIAERVAKGLALEFAAPIEGISKSTAYDWKRRGATGEQPFAGFLERIEKAEATWVAAEWEAVGDAKGGKDAAPWTNRAWRLERRHPDKFGRTVQTVEHTGSVATVKVELPDMPGASQEERLASFRALSGKAERE